MIDRRPLGHARNAPIGRCSVCSQRREVFEIDGTDVRLCATCITTVVEEAGDLTDARRQLYEGATYGEWLDCHQGHWKAVVGCPMCGAGSVS